MLDRCGEWVGAAVTMPSYVTGEGPPYRPVVMLWIEVETGWVLGTKVVHPDEALGRAAGLFHLATREPAMGSPRMPTKIRIADPTLATAVRGAVGDVELVIAPTPEIDEVVAAMHDHFTRDHGPEEDDGTYIAPDAEPSDIGAMFSAAAALYRTAPWDALPSDMFVAIESPGLGTEIGAMCVVGQMGESYGFSLFRTIAGAEEFMGAVDARQRGLQAALPQHVMFGFDDRREVPKWALSEIAKHRWEVAGPRAYPRPVMVDPDMVARGLTRDEVRTVTEIMIALADLVTAKRQELLAIDDALQADDPEEIVDVSHRAVVKVPWGETAVTLSAPLLIDVEDDDEPGGSELIDAFERSTGGETHAAAAEMLAEHVERFFDIPFEMMEPADMQGLLLEVLPRHLSVEASECGELVEALRALLAFCAAELESAESAACLSALTPALAAKFERAMRDDRKFGPAKTMIMAGIRAGYDLSSQEGLDAYMEHLAARGPAPRKPKPKASPKKPAARAKAKAKAKAQKKQKKRKKR